MPVDIRKPRLRKRNTVTYGLSLCLWQVVMIVLLGSKRGSFHLLPDYGTILPSTGATFCHCQAQNDTSGERFQPVYHFHLPEAFWLLERKFLLVKTLLSFLLLTLHRFAWNPDKHRGCERWRVVAHSSQLFTTLHLITKLSHHWWLDLVIIEDQNIA